MLNNKKKDMTPFDMSKKPVRQYPFLVPLVWLGSWIMTRQFKLKIHKKNMEGIKPPFLVFSTHQGFSDYYITPLALFPHRANYVSDMEGFAAFGAWLYRGIGCIGKRRYVPDLTVVKNIKYALDKKQPVVIYPESRHSNVGTTSYIPENLGKLAKLMHVPVVVLSVHGSYLANPFWDEEHTRKVSMEAALECVYTGEELTDVAEQEVQKKICDKLQYDEYAWQKERKIQITYLKRAEGLHKALYQCRTCYTEFQMQSREHTLYCEACGKTWEMDEYGRLVSGEETVHIPHWYEWQREQTEKELVAGRCIGTYPVRVEALPNEKGFISLGEGMLILDEVGFTVKLSDGPELGLTLQSAGHFLRNLKDNTLFFPHASRESVQTEYNYRGRGAAIVLSDKDCCYYIYVDEKVCNPTKFQFVGEYWYQKKH